MQLNVFLRFRRGPAGRLRRMLALLGPSWAASPARRIVQAASLILFAILLFYVCWPQGVGRYAEAMQAREFVEAETFLALDPLVSISTAIAARTWIWSLTWAGAILLACLAFPRGFCGYLCPLGTVIDLFDWAVGRRVKRFRIRGRGRWVHLRYYILTAVLVASVFGVLASGFVAAIPVLTRAVQAGLAPLQIGLLRGWHLVPPISVGQLLSIGLFLGLLALCLLGPRFWCRYLCPTGAIFSLGSLCRLTERKVAASCIRCGQCIESCPFDAIEADFTTRAADCTFCQTCGGVCPVHAIQFVGRRARRDFLAAEAAPAGEVGLSRRGFLAGTAGGLAAAVGIGKVFGPQPGSSLAAAPVRPPGAVPERRFLQMCVRCGACLKSCPTNTLQPLGFQQGMAGLWTPQAVGNWSGCDPSCSICGQVCPTGAIRALPLAEKSAARMGLAVVNEQICLPHSGRGECAMCVRVCADAGYKAIQFIRVHIKLDDEGMPVEDSGYLAPAVLPERCVGCGLCQARCFRVNSLERGLLKEGASSASCFSATVTGRTAICRTSWSRELPDRRS